MSDKRWNYMNYYREQLRNRMLRKDRNGDFIEDISVSPYYNPYVVEEPQELWLNKYRQLKMRKPHEPTCPLHQRTQPAEPIISQDSAVTYRTHNKVKVCQVHGPVVAPSLSEKDFINVKSVHSDTDSLQKEEDWKTIKTKNSTTKYMEAPQEMLTSMYSYAADNYETVNIFPKIVYAAEVVLRYLHEYPMVGLALVLVFFGWWIWIQIDFCISIILAHVVSFLYPIIHWITISMEQLCKRAGQMATSLDEMMEAFYCDFSRSWCHKFKLMCNVQCSFVDHALQRMRKKE